VKSDRRGKRIKGWVVVFIKAVVADDVCITRTDDAFPRSTINSTWGKAANVNPTEARLGRVGPTTT
jgi:hypothetical protein